MPFIPEDEDMALPIGMLPEAAEVDAPAASTVIGAAFRQQNSLVSAITAPTLTDPVNPAYDPYSEIAGTPYEAHASAFRKAQGPGDVAKIKTQIDRENADRDVLARRPGLAIISSIAAGTLSPEMLLPLGGGVAGAYRAGRVVRGVAAGATAGVTGAAISEAALMASQYDRDPLDTYQALAGGAVLGGMFGGAAGAIGKLIGDPRIGTMAKTAEEAGAKLRDDVVAAVRGPEPGQSSVGAAEAVTTTLEDEGLKGALGIEKVLKFQDPLQRMLGSSSAVSRRAAQALTEIPMTLRKNAQGIATGVEGGAVETRVKAWGGKPYAFESELEDLYAQYRVGRAARPGEFSGWAAADAMRLGGDDGPMSFAAFKDRVARAARRGDVDPGGDEWVTKAAQSYRRNIDDAILKDGVAVGIWKDIPDIGDTAVSHVTRVYDKAKIKARRPEFVRIAADWLVRRADGPDNLPVPEAVDMAEQITDTILGTPDGRLPYDIDMGELAARAFKGKMRPTEAGLFKERTFGIADREIEDFLENDIAVIARRQVRSMAPDIELARTFGDVAGTKIEKEIAEDFNKRIAKAKTEKERVALGKEKDANLRDFAAMRDRLRGTYRMPDDPDAWTVRAARTARQVNFVSKLGGMTLSSLADVARPVMIHGLGRVFGDGLAPMIRNFKAFRASADELNLMGVGLDMFESGRAEMIADVMDDYGRHSRFERTLQGLSNKMGMLSLMAPWNAALKQFSGVITMTRIVEACEAAAKGTIKPKELEKLAAAGISRDTAEQIAQQFAKHGGDVDGVKIPNTTAWDAPRSVVDAFKSAIIRDVDRIIVTPGIGDRPLWMSSETGKLIGQFKSFGFASVQRTLIPALQDRDAGVLGGLAFAGGMGMLSYAVKAKIAGKDLSDDPTVWVKEGVDRSGAVGWLSDAYNIMAKGFGQETSRYASRSFVESLVGPTFGGGLDLAGRVVTDIGRGEFDQGTVHAIRRMTPYQNLFWLNGAFNAAEQGINTTLGVPEKG